MFGREKIFFFFLSGLLFLTLTFAIINDAIFDFFLQLDAIFFFLLELRIVDLGVSCCDGSQTFYVI